MTKRLFQLPVKSTNSLIEASLLRGLNSIMDGLDFAARGMFSLPNAQKALATSTAPKQSHFAQQAAGYFHHNTHTSPDVKKTIRLKI